MGILRVAEWTVDFGGSGHSGWLPAAAAPPPPTPVVRANLALAILQDSPTSSCILEWCGSTEETSGVETSGDSCHESLADALAEAEHAIGLAPEAWTPLDSSPAA